MTTEVQVKRRKPRLDILGRESSNHFRFRLGPGEISLSLSARVKRPGEELVSKAANLSAVEEPAADEVDAYERLQFAIISSRETLVSASDRRAE
jgi:glucose-6-phosphate 1-dehydrogenase